MNLEGEVNKVKEFLLREEYELQKLLEDVEKLESILNSAKSTKDEALQQFYEHAIKSEEKVVERIERRLDNWIQQLQESLRIKQTSLSAEQVASIEKVRDYINLCRANFVSSLGWQRGELHRLIEQKKWDDANKLIHNCLGDEKAPGIVSLLIVLRQLNILEKEDHNKIIMDFVIGYSSPLIESTKTVKKIYIDQEDEVENGQIMTEGLDSCVGYVFYIVPKKKVYVAHYNGIPEELLFESKEDFAELLDYDAKQIIAFLLGGDGNPLSSGLVKKFYRAIKDMAMNQKYIILFGEVSSQVYRELNNLIVMPKASGVCVDTQTGKIRLTLTKSIRDDQKQTLREVLPKNVDVV